MIIRSMEERDTEVVLSFMIPFYASEAVIEKAPEAVLRQDIADCVGDCPYLYGFVAEEEDGSLSGYCMTALSYTTEFGGICVWIEDIYFDPAHRGMGYGTKMLQFVEERYRGEAVRLRLEAEPENERAVAAYRKNGFAELPYMQMTKVYGRS